MVFCYGRLIWWRCRHVLENKRMGIHLWSQPPPEGMISFSLRVNFSSGINIWFSLNWSDQLCPDLNWSPRQAKTPNRPCHCLLFFSCLDIVINRWMTAHRKFLMRDFEIRKGGKQSQFMAWSYSISRDPPEKLSISSLMASALSVMHVQSTNPISLPPLLFPEKPHDTFSWFSDYGMRTEKLSRKHNIQIEMA